MLQSLYYHESPQGSCIRPSCFHLGTSLHDATRGATQRPRTRTPEVESTYRVYHGVEATQSRKFVREQLPNLRLQAELPALSRLRAHMDDRMELDSTIADLRSRANAVRSLRAENERHSPSPNGGPSRRPPSPPPPPSFPLPPPAPLLLQEEEELKGQEPIVFNSDRSKTEEFLTQWELYSGVNYTNSAIQMPFTRAMLFLTYIQGVQVNKWVAAQSTWLISDVAHRGVPATTVALWTDLKDTFKRAFTDTLAQERAQATLKRGLHMNGMDVDVLCFVLD
jgi:hypothetical protein